MKVLKKSLPSVLLLALFVAFAAAPALADDRSFSSVVKYIQKNYKGKRQGTFGGITFGRFLVKLIKPAGVKNFKVVMFKSVDYSHLSNPEDLEFHQFVRTTVNPEWRPLVQYNSQRNKQWTYVYAQQENEDVKLLVVTLQQKQAFVVQLKFSPEKLIAFIDDPKIMGISLKDKTDPNAQNTQPQDSTSDPPKTDAEPAKDKTEPPPDK